MGHLESLRKFVLLASGEWSNSLIAMLSNTLGKADQGKLGDEATLSTVLMQDMLTESRQAADPNAARLSFKLGAEAPAMFRLDDIESLDFVSLAYDSPW